jgi:two-component system, NarL family, response regulator NreC
VAGRFRILVADDHALIRELLARYLNEQKDMEVIAQAADTDATLRQAVLTKPDLILLDITMPGGGGIAILPDLRRQNPAMRVLIVTMHDEPSYLRAALAAGANGYVVKSSPPAALLDAIRMVCQGERYIDESMSDYVPAKSSRRSKRAPIDSLSDREREVLIGLAHGFRYQTIADQIRVSVKTIETYRSRLVAKLGFKSRADLVRFAIEAGILGNPES